MNLIDILIPADQAEGTTSVIATWFKQVGDGVKEHEPLLELSTDKVTVEIAAPADGILAEILKGEGESVEPGEVVGRLGGQGEARSEKQEEGEARSEKQGEGEARSEKQEEGEARSEKQGEGEARSEKQEEGEARSEKREAEQGRQGGEDPEAPVGAGRARPAAPVDGDPPPLSPAVRRLLKEHGLDASQVEGTGKGGRITADDVERVVAAGPASSHPEPEGKATPTAASHPEPEARDLKARERAESEIPRSARNDQGALPSRRVPHSQMRKSIAAHMVHSVATAPHVTTVFDADLTKVIRHRELNRAEAESRGFKLTYTAYFVQATVRALQAVPEVNSRWHDDALELFDDCNIGVGTALEDGGLIVPVIPRAQTLDLLQTAERLGDLTARARGGKLTPADVQHGTFTISNHGVSGSILATPIIINQPQSAILGVGRMEKRVIVAEAYGHAMTEIRPMLYVTLTIDHRVLDGFQANRFLTEWVRVVEGWDG